MAKKKGSRGKVGALLLAAAIIVVGLVIGFWLSGRSRITSKPEPPKVPYATGQAPQERDKVKIYVMKIIDDEPKLVSETRSVPTGADPHKIAVERLLATNREVGPSQNLIPIGTKLLSLDIHDGIAYVNFSRELKENFNGGSEQEALLINSIFHTLSQFEGVKKVQILIEGKKVDTIGGHLEISEPVAADSTLLGPGESQ